MRGVVIDMKDISDSREVMESKNPKVITVFTKIIFAVLTALLIYNLVKLDRVEKKLDKLLEEKESQK